MLDAQSAIECDVNSADVAGDDSDSDSADESLRDSAYQSADESASDSASYSECDSRSAVSVIPRRLKVSIRTASSCTLVCGVF